ncbi:DUF6382 domain-containing protein [Clostridium akagii]|uniref:DUF6382 domain-containing protein n=1 Tax=Clostridium akagii TaxID=91623 RepID=UPI00047A6B35|nr:DUF6382 domain-containing protein [Clostridium akagii]
MDKNALKFEFENDPTKHYIVTYLKNEQDIVNYEVETINKNPTSGALNIEIKQFNDKIKVMYNITNKTPIKKYLENETLRKCEFITILVNLADCLVGCKNYFLDEKKFLINIDTLFIDEKNLKVYLLYCPFKMEVLEDTNLVYRDMVKNLIIDYLSFDEKDSENVIQKTLAHLRKDEFNMVEFKNHMEELKKKNVNAPCDTGSMEDENQYYIKNQSENLDNGINNKTIHKDTVKKITNIKKDETKASIDNVLIMFLQLIVLGIVGLIAMIGSFGVVMIAVIVVIIAMDLILVFVFIKNNGVKKNKSLENKLDGSPIRSKLRKINGINKTSKREIITEISFETELLDHGVAYLLSKKAGTLERIYIDKSKFRIGRMPLKVDYVSENIAIGKIHAEIRKEVDKYYVVDLNSRNGTYVNGKKLNGNELYEIKNEDIILFANSEYTFFTT